MNVTKLAILGVGLLAGIAAFVLVLGNDTSPVPVQVVQPKKEKTVRVLVAVRDFTRGERIAVEDTEWVTWPEKAVQPHFITDANAQKREDLVGAVARSLIVTGEPMIERKIVQAGSSGLMAAILSPGMRAVTLRVSPETSSGGFILPGDRVDIHLTSNNSSNIVSIKENVRVLAVNAVFAEQPGATNIPGNTVTVEMTPDEAEFFLVQRSTPGTMHLTLRSIFEPEGEGLAARARTGGARIIRYGES